jgi:glyoxylase-like metal-dependent hydrolase (beta-lactamase superfamily II)
MTLALSLVTQQKGNHDVQNTVQIAPTSRRVCCSGGRLRVHSGARRSAHGQVSGAWLLPCHAGRFRAEKTNKALLKSFEKNPLEISVNAFLINTGSKLVLIDTGAGALFGPTLGKLAAHVKAAGYQPEQVDEIYITHMHADHVGGLIGGEKLAFPNAVVRAGKADADYWLSQANLDQAPAEKKGFFQGAMASMNPYVAANKFQPITQDAELVPGIKAHVTAGHTPGHVTYMIESKGQKLVLLGDLMHVAAVQFENPSVTIAFDSDEKVAESSRKAAFAAAAKAGYLIGAAHLPFPALGHLKSNGKGYTFIPVDYAVPR